MRKKEIRKDNVMQDYETLFGEDAEPRKSSAFGVIKGLFKANKKHFSMSVLIYIIKNSASWIIPIATANIINAVTYPNENTLKIIAINAIITTILIVQNLFTHMWYVSHTSKALRQISAGLRNTLIKKLQQLSITYHKEISTGKLQSKFLRDIEAVEILNSQIINGIMPAVMALLFISIYTLVKNPLVTLFYLLIAPINVLLVRMFCKKLRANNRQFRTESERFSAKLSDTISMIPITRAHGLENKEIEKNISNIEKLKEAGLAADKTQGYFGSLSWIAGNILSMLCLIVTALFAYKKLMPAGDIIVYTNFFAQMLASVQSLTGLLPEISKGTESISSISEVMNSREIEENEGKIPLRYVHGTVRFKNVSYHYPHDDKTVIKNFNLNVEKGECVAIVGPSGSGKTTIMNMIIGFLSPTEGEISIDGKPMDLINLTTYRKFMSVVPQNSILFTGSIRENILYGVEDTPEEKLQEVIDLANIREFVDQLPDGLNTMIGEHGDKLSGGQKQRISIARALIRDPKIIILDEATSALDNISEYQVQKAMASLIKGRTTFIVAHRLSTIRDADKIVVMDKGECVEYGTYDELMEKKGKFYELKTLSDLNINQPQ